MPSPHPDKILTTLLKANTAFKKALNHNSSIQTSTNIQIETSAKIRKECV